MNDDASLSPSRARYAYADYVLSKATGKIGKSRMRHGQPLVKNHSAAYIHMYVCMHIYIGAMYVEYANHRRKSGKDMQKSRSAPSEMHFNPCHLARMHVSTESFFDCENESYTNMHYVILRRATFLCVSATTLTI